ncbi:MAG: sortase [Oscillospiraceae bacterium]|nr:sortase [Oscillospiraceae bacterium]
MKRKLRGTILIVLGLALAFSGAALYGRYEREAAVAGQNAQHLLQELHYDLSQRHLLGVEAEAPEGQMPQIMLDGYALLGVFTAEEAGIELPIIENWNYEKLKHSPCRYSGSLAEGNLVLLGHNYASHLGNLSQLEVGDSVTFTDITGKIHRFCVAETATLRPEQVQAVEESPYPLTVFTCTPSGKSRFVVYCEASSGQ